MKAVTKELPKHVKQVEIRAVYKHSYGYVKERGK